jgi:hypothetical protein
VLLTPSQSCWQSGLCGAVCGTGELAGVSVRSQPLTLYPAVLKDTFILCWSSLPPGSPGEGPDCNFARKIVGFVGDSGPDPGETYFHFDFGPKRSWREK